MKPSALLSARFHERASKHGAARKGCGIAARDLALTLRERPLRPQRIAVAQGHRKYELTTPGNNGALGALIKQGMARFDRESGSYSLTPQGDAWLNALAACGLLTLTEDATA